MKIFARFYYIWNTCGWGGWNTKDNKVSNLSLAALIISERIAAPEENAKKNRENRMKMRMRRGLINRARVRYSWGRSKLAGSMMEKCARQHIPEVVPLSSWSLKMNKALAVRARNVPKNLKKFEQSYRKEVSDNGWEVKSFAWHALSLSLSQFFLSISLLFSKD